MSQRKYIHCTVLLSGVLLSFGAGAAIALSGTRVIYAGAAREATLGARNTSEAPFVIQSWVESTSGGLDVPFMVVPPLVRIDPGKESMLRVIRAGGTLPEDRESVYWLNVKEIPQVPTIANSLQIAVRSQIKLFYRPPGLDGGQSGPTMLRWRLMPALATGRCELSVQNASAFHVTFSGVRVTSTGWRNQDLELRMVAPFSRQQWILEHCNDNAGFTIQYSIVNDFGANEEVPSFMLRPVSTDPSAGR
ncbi:molecular chaperone [Burkholderia pyrrocinia]|uniref:Molecular chaperone n=1 Tax=Burkholderia pyrrocinia TaxID=60550 RepID=A0ABZ3BN70_BURPY